MRAPLRWLLRAARGGRVALTSALPPHRIAKPREHRRQVIAALSTQAAAFKLVDEIAPQLTGRTSGHVRVQRTRLRVGDGAQLATIAFVDELKPVTREEVKA